MCSPYITSHHITYRIMYHIPSHQFLSSGHPVQKFCVVNVLPTLLSTHGLSAFDALMPQLMVLLPTLECETQRRAAEVYTTLIKVRREC